MSSIAISEHVLAGGTRLLVRRVANARAMRLSVDPRQGCARLTLPPRAALKPALAWAESRRGWIDDALAALPPRVALSDGALFPLRGVPTRIGWDVSHPRAPALAEGCLRVGGAVESIAARVGRWLTAAARAQLTAESIEFAGRAGVAIGRVRIGDPRSRWGSCTRAGDLAYSWRLILAPDFVRRATVAHEIAHRLHMDHSPAFHAAHASLLEADPAGARAWLRANGRDLHRYG